MIENEVRRMTGTRPCLFVQTHRQIALSSNTKDRPSCFCKTCTVPDDRHIASGSDLLVYSPQNPPRWAKFSTVGPLSGCEWAILEKFATLMWRNTANSLPNGQRATQDWTKMFKRNTQLRRRDCWQLSVWSVAKLRALTWSAKYAVIRTADSSTISQNLQLPVKVYRIYEYDQQQNAQSMGVQMYRTVLKKETNSTSSNLRSKHVHTLDLEDSSVHAHLQSVRIKVNLEKLTNHVGPFSTKEFPRTFLCDETSLATSSLDS